MIKEERLKSGLKRLKRVQMLELISNEFFSPSASKFIESSNKGI
jgi:hypothetical protein